MNPPKYPSTPHWPWSQTVHRDDSYHLAPEYFVGKNVVITEKLDGGNTLLHNGEVYARSTSAPSHAGWMAMVRKHHAYKTLIDCGSPRFYYGEDIYGIHSIEYAPINEANTYHLFAVREEDYFVSWDTVEALAETMDIYTVPMAYRGQFNTVDEITEFFSEWIENGSIIGGGDCEGFVIRITDGFDATDFSMNVAKYVRANHVQTDQHWRKNWKPCRLEKA